MSAMKGKKIEEMSKIFTEIRGHIWFLLSLAAERRDRAMSRLVLDVIDHLEDISYILGELQE